MNLQSKHIEWILSAAQRYFVEQIDKMELQIVIDQHFIDIPVSNNIMGNQEKSRLERIASSNNYLIQYREIVEFLAKARMNVCEASAKEFAKAFWASRENRPVSWGKDITNS